MSKVIGIDLGTTNSVVAVFEGGEPHIVSNMSGQRTTPSVVAFTAKGEKLVGPPARNQQLTNPQNSIYSIKRFMGRRHKEVLSEEKIVPYQIVGRPDEFVKVKIGRNLYTPQELSGIILHHLKTLAEAHLGDEVNRAVVTVPAYFNDSQRQATKDAGAIAGLKVERIINEPTAAALAYGFEKRENKRIVVFDFGGGTFDLSVMDIGDGTFRVIAVHGDTHLGGDDFDQRIIDVLADDFRRKERVDLRKDPMALQRLKEAAEKAKADLSTRTETTVMLPFIHLDGSGPKHLQFVLTREHFEALCTDLFESVRQGCVRILKDARVPVSSITEAVMVGGSTRMPKVQDIARELFQLNVLDKSINPDEVVALGAATLGGIIQGDLRNVQLMDVTSQSLGVETAGGGVATLIRKNTHTPTSTRQIFSTPLNNQTSVPIHVLEGESERAAVNRSLGLFQLSGIPKAPRGTPKIEVEFGVDIDGILKVSATDLATGRSQNVIIKGAIGLDRHDIERMQREQRATAEAKEEQNVTIDLRYHAESVLHDMRKWLEYNGHMLNPAVIKQLEIVLVKLQKKIHKDDKWGMRALLKRIDELAPELRKTG